MIFQLLPAHMGEGAIIKRKMIKRSTIIQYIPGQIIGSCIFIEEAGLKKDLNSKRNRRLGKFKCSCGNEFITSISNVKRGNTKSCGCYNKQRVKEANTIHGLALHPLYGIWQDMKNRCYNKNVKSYNSYGNKGIIVCNTWKNSFISFYTWAIKNNWKLGLQIDRINGKGNYEPNNCRVATYAQQSRNRKNNIIVSLNGISMCLKDYCEKLNINYYMVRHRLIDLKWSLEIASNTKRRTDLINELNG